jgi:mRNA interferase MazF
MMDYKRGDIVTINLNPKKGDEVGKIRPAVIVSGVEENMIVDTIIVMPLSTSLIDDMKPFRVRVQKREKLKHDSDVLINHIRAISKKRVGEKIASITESEYQEIVESLCRNFL